MKLARSNQEHRVNELVAAVIQTDFLLKAMVETEIVAEPILLTQVCWSVALIKPQSSLVPVKIFGSLNA